jgi:hypothetical protein
MTGALRERISAPNHRHHRLYSSGHEQRRERLLRRAKQTTIEGTFDSNGPDSFSLPPDSSELFSA